MKRPLRKLPDSAAARLFVAAISSLCAAALIAAAGCGSSPSATAVKDKDKAPEHKTGMQITLGGDGLNLGEAQQAGLRPEGLATIVGQLIAEKRFQSARLWVLRFPDVALELLRSGSPGQAADPAMRFIAAQHDRQCQAAGSGWSQVLADRAGHPAAHNLFQDHRAKVLAAMREGRLAEAASVDVVHAVPQTAPGELLHIEALRLHGIALLLHEDHAEAAAAFHEAVALARKESVFQAAHLLLLDSDASRRAAKAEDAITRWREALVLAPALLANQTGSVDDPTFWERAAYLRPHSCEWPAALAAPLTASLTERSMNVWQSDAATTNAGANAVERLLWSNVGIRRLARQEAQAAVVAFHRAQVLADSDPQRDELRLHQARALVQLEQHTAAMSMLVGLMGKRTPVGRSALAVAGVMSIEQGQTQRGLALLNRAVDSDQLHNWPGRIQTQIDLGLAYLVVGDENTGFAALHRAQEQLSGENVESLIKSLRNERRYHEALSQKERLAPIDTRLQTLEQLPGLFREN